MLIRKTQFKHGALSHARRWYNKTMIIGVDEVGRGCLAGPLVAGAVLLAKPIRGLRDSKKLTRLQREKFDATIRSRAVAFGLGWVSASELDEIGLTAAVRLAMERAVADMNVSDEQYEQIIIDGNYNYLAAHPKSSCLIKADDTVPAVSAASIIAKVARDAYMRQMAATFPKYSFEDHVGYGTPKHLSALQAWGACELHRVSFAPVRAIMPGYDTL